VKGQRVTFRDATTVWFIGWKIHGHDIDEISSSLIRLSKFRLIEFIYDRTAGKDVYDTLKTHVELTNILERYQKANPRIDLEITATNSVLYVNEYGKQFKNACK